MCKESTGLSYIEVESLINTVKSFTPEELKIVVHNLPVDVMCNEIAERHKTLLEKISGINDIINV